MSNLQSRRAGINQNKGQVLLVFLIKKKKKNLFFICVMD